MALLCSTAVTGHEHHMNKIKEGDAISDDPIVRPSENWYSGQRTLIFATGLDTMDAYLDPVAGLGHHISDGHGIRRMCSR
jgi:hypothetical protein